MERFENLTLISKGYVIAMLTGACSTIYEGPRQHDVFKYIRISKYFGQCDTSFLGAKISVWAG